MLAYRILIEGPKQTNFYIKNYSFRLLRINFNSYPWGGNQIGINQKLLTTLQQAGSVNKPNEVHWNLAFAGTATQRLSTEFYVQGDKVLQILQYLALSGDYLHSEMSSDSQVLHFGRKGWGWSVVFQTRLSVFRRVNGGTTSVACLLHVSVHFL